MKKYIVILFLPFLLVCCEQKGVLGIEDYVVYDSEFYICGYERPAELSVRSYVDGEIMCLALGFVSDSDGNRNMADIGKEYDEYLQLCTKHHEKGGFMRKVTYWKGGDIFEWHTFYDFDPISIDVFSDADFDENHPAGTSLGDIVVFEGTIPYPFINNGYDGSDAETVCKKLDELTTEDMILCFHNGYMTHIGDYDFQKRVEKPNLLISQKPALYQYHNFTVTITDDYGCTFSAVCSADFRE